MSGFKGQALLWEAGAIYARRIETDGERMWYQCVFCPYMNFEFNVCSYSLTSCVNLRCHSQTDSGPDLNMSAPFIPAATALPFTSCHKGQRALTFGVQPSHWIIHDIDLFFPLFFPLSLFLVSTHGCAVGGFYSFSSFIKASPHLFTC